MARLDHSKFEAAMHRIASEIKADEHHRLRSWDHARHHFFGYASGRSGDTDLAALNLAMYLASWGMYRGSTDLLYRDYKVLVPVVGFLKEEAANGWTDQMFSDRPAEELAKKLKGLEKALEAKLLPKLSRPDDPHVRVTDTLASKILLVTLACVPAFDTQVKAALKDIFGSGSADEFGARRMIHTIRLARDHTALIDSGRKIIKEGCGIDYPPTRVFDLYLWLHGEALPKPAKKDRS